MHASSRTTRGSIVPSIRRCAALLLAAGLLSGCIDESDSGSAFFQPLAPGQGGSGGSADPGGSDPGGSDPGGSDPGGSDSPGLHSVTLSWYPPTERDDGSPLTNLAGYHIYYGNSASDLDAVVTLENPGLSAYMVEGLSAGVWHFSMTAFDSDGVESRPTPTVSTWLQ